MIKTSTAYNAEIIQQFQSLIEFWNKTWKNGMQSWTE